MKYFNENDVKNIKSYNFDFIEFEESNHVFTLTLDRPKKKNALNPQMINEIAFVLQYVSNTDSIRALLLKSNGDVFCLGEQNLKKYHEESTKVSRVSVSLNAFFPVDFWVVIFQSGWLSNGLPFACKSTSSGSSTGNSLLSTGTTLPSSK